MSIYPLFDILKPVITPGFLLTSFKCNNFIITLFDCCVVVIAKIEERRKDSLEYIVFELPINLFCVCNNLLVRVKFILNFRFPIAV